ncbi:hypothetical protein CONLIGDRAFT_406187 [Coniochaeta ligniaria NRRL 30616]|uniref:Uncharacterized protein n=1 Tax=Coniochaeta ligniaria NRRL 30616 TaxID=1408157 RepID=A0A1J7INJ0_9PEZI|nr:hypothetical protein CONLIGDRAFT_406187 [Coniochaeta ligniaria NRRL 30616]
MARTEFAGVVAIFDGLQRERRAITTKSSVHSHHLPRILTLEVPNNHPYGDTSNAPPRQRQILYNRQPILRNSIARLNPGRLLHLGQHPTAPSSSSSPRSVGVVHPNGDFPRIQSRVWLSRDCWGSSSRNPGDRSDVTPEGQVLLSGVFCPLTCWAVDTLAPGSCSDPVSPLDRFVEEAAVDARYPDVAIIKLFVCQQRYPKTNTQVADEVSCRHPRRNTILCIIPHGFPNLRTDKSAPRKLQPAAWLPPSMSRCLPFTVAKAPDVLFSLACTCLNAALKVEDNRRRTMSEELAVPISANDFPAGSLDPLCEPSPKSPIDPFQHDSLPRTTIDTGEFGIPSALP